MNLVTDSNPPRHIPWLIFFRFGTERDRCTVDDRSIVLIGSFSFVLGVI